MSLLADFHSLSPEEQNENQIDLGRDAALYFDTISVCSLTSVVGQIDPYRSTYVFVDSQALDWC